MILVLPVVILVLVRVLTIVVLVLVRVLTVVVLVLVRVLAVVVLVLIWVLPVIILVLILVLAVVVLVLVRILPVIVLILVRVLAVVVLVLVRILPVIVLVLIRVLAVVVLILVRPAAGRRRRVDAVLARIGSEHVRVNAVFRFSLLRGHALHPDRAEIQAEIQVIIRKGDAVRELLRSHFLSRISGDDRDRLEISLPAELRHVVESGGLLIDRFVQKLPDIAAV